MCETTIVYWIYYCYISENEWKPASPALNEEKGKRGLNVY